MASNKTIQSQVTLLNFEQINRRFGPNKNWIASFGLVKWRKLHPLILKLQQIGDFQTCPGLPISPDVA